jgi:putative tricarboxylic transport membrane protein
VQKAEKQIAKGELVFTSFLFATSIVVLVDTTNMVESNAVGFVGPKVFAYMVGILLFVLSGIQLLAVIRGSRGEPEGIEAGVLASSPNWKALGFVGGGLVAYALLLEVLGFLVMGPLLYFAVAKAVGAKRNLLLAAVAVAVSVVVYVGFTQGLQLYLPLGFDFIFNPAGQESGW